MKSVVLISGGIDSTTCLWMARMFGPVTGLTVDYGQHAAEVERRTSAMFCSSIGASHRHIDIKGVGGIAQSALTSAGDASVASNAIVPGRNALLVSLGAALAKTVHADTVWIGCNKTDGENFADCSSAFLSALSDALKVGYDLKLQSPLLNLTKTDVVKTAMKLGVPIGATSSCYYGTKCEKCSACLISAKALVAALEAAP